MPLIHDTAHAFLPYPDAPVPHASTGPLSGLCFGVKDLFDVAGYPTGGGQPFVLAMSGIKRTPRQPLRNCSTRAHASSAKPLQTSWRFQ